MRSAATRAASMGGNPWSLIVATIGAMVVLLALHSVSGRRSSHGSTTSLFAACRRVVHSVAARGRAREVDDERRPPRVGRSAPGSAARAARGGRPLARSSVTP